MLIQVHYPDNRYDFVDKRMLSSLIESREIFRFKRSSGWVIVGVDPLRRIQRKSAVELVPEKKQGGTVTNFIRVEYSDFSFGYVSAEVLDGLIESCKIVKFQRKSGWVSVGLEPTRIAKIDVH